MKAVLSSGGVRRERTAEIRPAAASREQNTGHYTLYSAVNSTVNINREQRYFIQRCERKSNINRVPVIVAVYDIA